MDGRRDPERTAPGAVDARLHAGGASPLAADARPPLQQAAPGEVDARLRDLVVEAERQLLSPTVRGDRAALERMLDPRFVEIGQSGRLWTRADIIAELIAVAASAAAPSAGSAERDAATPLAASTHDALPDLPTRAMSEISTTALGPDTILLTYLLHFDGRWSRRSSIWVVGGGGAGAGAGGGAGAEASASANASAGAGAGARIVFHQGTTVPPQPH